MVDELGSHVSAADGVDRAPERAHDIGAVVLQLFTKQPARWAEPKIDDELATSFERESVKHGIEVTVAHDSYLINLASPDRRLWRMSLRCFEGELSRATVLGLDFVVTHPGNATDGDLASGLARNAEGVERALEAVPGSTAILLELTAGSGTSVGATFENLRTIIEAVPPPLDERVGICFDTCHALAGGYDLVDDYDGVWSRFDDVLGLARLRLFHLNDSKHPLGSHKDRHETLGEGFLGAAPFERLMLDERMNGVPKILETPKRDDPVASDLRNLAFLRDFRLRAAEADS